MLARGSCAITSENTIALSTQTNPPINRRTPQRPPARCALPPAEPEECPKKHSHVAHVECDFGESLAVIYGPRPCEGLGGAGLLLKEAQVVTRRAVFSRRLRGALGLHHGLHAAARRLGRGEGDRCGLAGEVCRRLHHVWFVVCPRFPLTRIEESAEGLMGARAVAPRINHSPLVAVRTPAAVVSVRRRDVLVLERGEHTSRCVLFEGGYVPRLWVTDMCHVEPRMIRVRESRRR
mmetsp:Transcript_21191/g.41238  ORF Transcript_21191/g.41238 Transcript_21191/m.41238 type:complete len:235 (-) Transcript_21191:150-854(-)